MAQDLRAVPRPRYNSAEGGGAHGFGTDGRAAGKALSLLRREFGLSAGLVKRLKWQNALFVNDAPAHTDAPVMPGDRVRVVLEERTEGFEPEPLPLSILYEDECFLAVDKPSGMLVHPSPQKNSGTLANGVLYHLLARGEASGVHPVTRLDRDTFGVVILAKNANIHDRFCRMLRERRWRRPILLRFSASRRRRKGRSTCRSIRSAAGISSVLWTSGDRRR